MEDDFEYFITFPTPRPYIDDLNRKFTPHKVSPSAEDSGTVAETQVGVDDECPPQTNNELDPGDLELCDLLPYFQVSGEKQPVVLMLGWFGARDDYLAKYAGIYTARGCICLRYTAPPSYKFFVRTTAYMAPFADRLLTVLQEMDLHTHPLICHAFSNHGSTLYFFISEKIDVHNARAEEQGTAPIRLVGCVFDSCPAPRRIWAGMLAIYHAAPGPRWLRSVAAFASWFLFAAWTVVSNVLGYCTGRTFRRLPWDLLNESRRVPQLFLYSDADPLIPSQDVQKFWTHRKRLGVPVYAKRWPDSPHVQHYKYYPEEYTRVVFRFVCECLSGATVTKSC